MNSSLEIEVWGISTCGSVKKTMKWLEENGIPFEFMDFRKIAPPKSLLNAALQSVSSPRKLLNTSGASYREGGWRAKADAISVPQLIEALLADPMLIKRPLVRSSKGVAVGFNEELLRGLL